MGTQGTYKAVFLDGMGTLIRLVPPAPALALALGVGQAVAERAFRAEAAYYVRHHLEGADSAGLDQLRERCAEVLADAAGVPREGARQALLAAIRFEAFPDAAPVLGELRARGLALVVVSNWDCALPQVLAAIGIADLVDDVIASAAVGAAKPGRAIFERACRAAGCAPAEALHVGDSALNDVEGARRAGIRAVLLDRAGAAGVDAISSLSQLPALLS